MKSTLFVFADESGIHDTAPYCVLAGYIGSPRQWIIFEKKWSELLDEYGLSEFHAKRFFARDNEGKRVSPFHGWSDFEARQFLARLVAMINERRLYPIVGVVDVAAFNTLSVGERRFLTGGNILKSGKWDTHGAPTKPYYLAFQFFIVEAMQRAVKGKTVHFIFDRQNVLQSRAGETFYEIIKVIERGESLVNVSADLGNIAFRNSAHEEGLQAADLLTHGWYSYLTRRDTMSDERMDAMDMLSQKRESIRMLDAGAMQTLLGKLPPNLLAQIQAGEL